MFNLKLLACYLAAIIHDFEHRGVNNDFLIKTSDHLALLYNDSSPMENHHVASAFMLMKEDQYAFFPAHSKRVSFVNRIGLPTPCCLHSKVIQICLIENMIRSRDNTWCDN